MKRRSVRELGPASKPPEEEWGDIIRTVLPERYGMDPALFMERAYEEAANLSQLPSVSATKALFSLAATGELQLRPDLIVRTSSDR